MRRHTGAAPAVVRRIHGFVLNAVYRAGDWIVKLPYDRASLDAEVYALARARSAGVPAPDVAAHGNEPRPYLLLELVAGEPMWDGGDDVLRQAAAHFRALHELRLDGAGWLSGARFSHGDIVAFEHDSWTQFLDRSAGVAEGLARAGLLTARDVGSFAGVLDRHRDELRPEGRPRLCHGDVHPRHLFAVDGRLTGIIDWQDAFAGDPALDLARLTRYERPGVLQTFLGGYEPDASLAARLPIAIPAYRMVWSAWTASFELRGDSDWVSHHIAAIRGALWELT